MIEEKELKQITGGSVTASWLTAIVRGATTIVDLGRTLGTVIRRLQNGNLC